MRYKDTLSALKSFTSDIKMYTFLVGNGNIAQAKGVNKQEAVKSLTKLTPGVKIIETISIQVVWGEE